MLRLVRAGRNLEWCPTLCRHYVAPHAQAAQATTDFANNDEYSDEAIYPPIEDLTFSARKLREKLTWQQEIQKTPTVEEKLIKINMPRYYGYKVVMLGEDKLPYNYLPGIQHYTRTLLEVVAAEKADAANDLTPLVERVKQKVLDSLELSYDFHRQKGTNDEKSPVERERLISKMIVKQIHQSLVKVLRPDYPHLLDLEADYEPRHEAFWAVGGIEAPKNVIKSKEGRKWQKDMAKEDIDRYMQYKGEPMLALRHPLQLTPWKNENEYTDKELAKKVPQYHYDPRTLGLSTHYQHGTNIPGYWPHSWSGFAFLMYQPRTSMHLRPSAYGPEDHLEALHCNAIQSSFAWLLAQANYNGFNTYSELTYPLNTQTIVTNGKHWSFYEYQLNTLLFSGNNVHENPRVNYCRGTPELKLFEEIDESGKVVGFNENTLRWLVKFYINRPTVQRTVDELTPFLHPQYKYVADYPDEEKREFLEKRFKHMCSNRPRHLAIPEIYMWEKIYKIDNKTRPMEARRRFFELSINPWKRTLDQHQKEYIPKALRPEGPKSKKKWKPTYYP